MTHPPVRTVHWVSAGWDTTACEGVSLQLPDSALFSGLWLAEILSRTVRKPKIQRHIEFRKAKIFGLFHPDVL